jgi:hypothetical protein
MDIKYKIKLIDILHLNPSDIESFNFINLSKESLDEMMSGNNDKLLKELEATTNNSKVEERQRLLAACYFSKLKWYMPSEDLDAACEEIADNMSFGLIGSDDDETYWKEREEQAKENQAMWKEREKTAKESQKKLAKMTTEKICDEIFDYTIKKYPELADGYNPTLYRSGREDYYEMLSVRHCPNLVKHQEWTKLNIAANNVEARLRAYADNVILDNIEHWKNEYEAWSDSHGNKKVTKSSIKNFFVEKGKKVSPTVIDKLKMELE